MCRFDTECKGVILLAKHTGILLVRCTNVILTKCTSVIVAAHSCDTECTGVTLALMTHALMAMLQALGKMATVLDIDNDGDLRVEVDGYRWLMSPVSCVLVHDPDRQSQESSTERMPTATSKPGNHSV